MSRVQLAIAVKEKEYVRRLADYVHSGPFRERCQLTAFTHAEACRQYVKQGFAIDLIAAEPALLPELKAGLPHIPTVALVDAAGQSGHDFEVLRFQALPQLMRSLLELSMPAAGDGEETRGAPLGGAPVLSVHSASGGVGKTALAVHLVHCAGTMGLRACYLNLERWDTAGLWLGKEGREQGEGMSELLYGLKAHGSVRTEWLAAHRRHDSLLKGDYLPGFNHPGDRETLEADDAVALVDFVAGSGYYDLVVVDLVEGMSELQMSVMERSRCTFGVVTDDRAAMGKLAQASRYAAHKWGERYARLQRRSMLVRNRAGGGESVLRALGLPPAAAVLPDVPEWRQGIDARLLDSPAFRAAAGEVLKLALKAGEMAHGK